MNQGEGKTGIRRARGLGRSEHLREFIGATALTLIGLFFLWQAWLILSELSGAKQAEQIKAWEVKQLGEEVARIRSRVQQAVDSASVAKALASQDGNGLEEAAATLRQIVPEAVSVEFFRPDVSDVLTSNFSKFGYSKAAMIVQAHRLQQTGPLQSQAGPDKKRLLALAVPAVRDKQVLAYAYVQMPIDPLLHVFRQQDISAARIDLRQGEGRGDFLLDSIGSDRVSTLDFPGEAVADSAFRVASAQPELPILVSRRLWLVLALAICSLALGMFLWYARKAGWDRIAELLYIWRPASMAPSPVLAQIPAASDGPRLKPPVREKADSLAGDPQERDISVDRSIFRAYDIRGVVGKTLTKGVARLIGRAIGSEARARDLREIVVARDGRLSGPDLVGALIEGLRSTGCDVIDIGAAATPLLYFATFQLNTGSGVMVTGSHNPPDYNGFKIVLGGETLSEDAIQNLYARISESRVMRIMSPAHEVEARLLDQPHIALACPLRDADAPAGMVLVRIGAAKIQMLAVEEEAVVVGPLEPSDPEGRVDEVDERVAGKKF